MRRGFKSEAERKSSKIRVELGLRDNERICCFTLLDYLEINCFSVEQLSDFGLDEDSIITITTGAGQREFSAILLYKSEGSLVIYNPKHSKKRVRSSIAHEASHVLCGHPFLKGKYGRTFLHRDHPKNIEDEANWQAGCLLVPKVGMEWAVRQGMKVADIADHFDVSKEMAQWRYNVLGMARRSRYMQGGSRSY